MIENFMQSYMNNLYDVGKDAYFWLLDFLYQYTLSGGTIMLTLYLITNEKKILSKLLKVVMIWLICEGVGSQLC